MTSIFTNVLSVKELEYLNNLPEVLAAKASIDARSSGMVYFSITVTDSIRTALQSRFGLELSTATIPMRWIKGDTAPHIDHGASSFQNTYLLYVNNSPGEFLVDSQSYPIEANTGFVFSEGLYHETQGTGNTARLLLGPMNEFAEPVGVAFFITYYPTEADALAGTNDLGASPAPTSGLLVVGDGGPFGAFTSWAISPRSTGSASQSLIYDDLQQIAADGYYYMYGAIPGYITYYPTEADALADTNGFGQGPVTTPLLVGAGGPYGGFTSWRLSSNSTGSASQAVVYSNSDPLDNDGYYFAYPAAPCFLEGSKILCQVDGVEKDVPVEELKNGTLVKTRLNGYKAVVLIGKGSIQNPGNDERTENRLYKCSPSKYPELKDDLYITGCHSILESKITDKQKEDTIKHLGRVFITDKKYRLMACLDDRAEPWNSEGVYSIWHFALENADDGMNYGVYANGLLVETCSIRALKNRSNMTLF